MGLLFIHYAMYYYIASIVMGVLSLVIPFIKESLQTWCGRGKVGGGLELIWIVAGYCCHSLHSTNSARPWSYSRLGPRELDPILQTKPLDSAS